MRHLTSDEAAQLDDPDTHPRIQGLLNWPGPSV
jgi:hypothetical protein